MEIADLLSPEAVVSHLKVAGKPSTARRVAWELAHGSLASGTEVLSCPDERACVNVDHLTLRGRTAVGQQRKRSSPGAG